MRKNSSYFANLEKKHAERKTVKCLKVNDRVIIDTKDFLKEERVFTIQSITVNLI